MEFNGAIKAARDRKGWSQGQLAAQLEVRQSTISQWEAGTKFPSRRQFAPLARALDLDLDGLLRLAFASGDNAKPLEASA